MKFYDLSFPFERGMPYFEGDPVPAIEQFKELGKDGYNIKKITIGTHTGTHIDAPAHFIKSGKTVDQLDPSDISGSATCIEYDPTKELKLPSQYYKILFLYTGYNLRWKEFTSFKNYSYIKEQDAEKLKDYGAKVIGIDSPSPEIPDSKDFSTHKILLGNSIPIVENLDSSVLGKLLNKSFIALILPLIIKDGDGSPVRVLALEV